MAASWPDPSTCTGTRPESVRSGPTAWRLGSRRPAARAWSAARSCVVRLQGAPRLQPAGRRAPGPAPRRARLAACPIAAPASRAAAKAPASRTATRSTTRPVTSALSCSQRRERAPPPVARSIRTADAGAVQVREGAPQVHGHRTPGWPRPCRRAGVPRSMPTSAPAPPSRPDSASSRAGPSGISRNSRAGDGLRPAGQAVARCRRPASRSAAPPTQLAIVDQRAVPATLRPTDQPLDPQPCVRDGLVEGVP